MNWEVRENEGKVMMRMKRERENTMRMRKNLMMKNRITMRMNDSTGSMKRENRKSR